ncbi:sigma-54 interaction domain-containing protein [Acinetobacter tibetensis]|uniref:Sigma-54 dependent transcriptional regulator n=1 Tax=Acinetobacter tibetensis TaxID=2943497 RepID=A0AAE9S1N1_9GAMM|nr:sigma-54 dependent transcriptional regulator [Acinetobacter tibetensis]USE84499.1 sigma-54 dependent transcriptional regulator [Acinetobacter tibetensis]
MLTLSFTLQTQLELFLEQLQSLIDESLILIQEQQSQNFIYEYGTSEFNKKIITTFKHLIQNTELQTGLIHLPETSAQYLLTRKKLDVLDQQFVGEIFVLQPVSLNTVKPKPVTALSLQQTFHSRSSSMQHMFSIIERVAITEFPVLVRGESGSGKELVAQAIHEHSQRRKHPFIAINCAALNASLLESELFGHVKGAFTGAIREHKGVFERAAGGTLFLDEIAEIPLELQAKLLRVLETGEFTPLGGEKSLKSNVRIIAATHRALREEVKSGRFRQDLLYRLRVIPIFVPPLRERKEDIPLIAEFLLNEHRTSAHAPVLSEDALQTLMKYDWPGNVRELKNTLLYALAMANGRSEIGISDLPDEIIHVLQDSVSEPETYEQAVQISSTKLDAYTLQQTLKKYQYDLGLTAQALGISRTSLWRYRKKFGI